ncbi:MAG: hypothetical protein L0271_00720, partial [Gemmatimonadetes bacterium]|nr:hypothetical protein [Gemmatimonadota bacterium]
GLTTVWRQSDVPASVHRDLAVRIARHTRLMWTLTVMEIFVLAGLAVFTGLVIRGGTSPLQLAALATLWVLAFALEAFALWNRRGSWRPDIESTIGYLDLAERRARAKIRAARAVRILVFLQIAAVLAFVLSSPSGAAGPNVLLLSFAIGGSLVIGFVVWSYWYERRARGELAELEAARALLRNGP